MRLFIFSLARELHMTVRMLLNNLDARELAEWMAFCKIESERMDKIRNPNSADTLSDKIKNQFGRKAKR